jgi:uncharacterized metal-binding protein YceD (DUF177 family)
MSPAGPTAEWPFAVPAARVGAEPLQVADEAAAGAREALARRFGILAIDALKAEVTLRRLTDGDIAATAHLCARLSQACVVTLEPVAETVDVTVEGRFSERAAEILAPGGETVVIIDPDDESDEPEPISGGMLDLGEWLAQQLSLAMDPYPRAPGAALDPALGVAEAEEPPTHRPFEGLARLRKDGDG